MRLQFSSPRYLAGPYACTEVIQLRVTFFATWYKLYRYQGKETTQVFNTKKQGGLRQLNIGGAGPKLLVTFYNPLRHRNRT